MDERPIVILAMPHGGSMRPAAARAFFSTTTRGGLRVARYDGSSSVLEANFNRLWCTGLNARDFGLVVVEGRPKYFAMLHSDVCPEEFWLDTMIEELERTGADLVSAVVPLKDGTGLTSTAIGATGDWRDSKLRRLTMTEVYDLPETFGREDINWPEAEGLNALLPNTGCWVARLDAPWADKVSFRTESEIKRASNGTWLTHSISEDWALGMDIADHGGTVMITRKVKLYHDLECFTNRRAWGDQKQDEIWFKAQAVRNDTLFPDEVEGWLTLEEGQALRELSTGKRVLEIGSYCGRSTICIAQTAESVVSLDPHDGRGTPSPQGTYQKFRANLKRYNVAEKVVSEWPIESDGPFDFIFIDGAHDYANVTNDIRTACERLAPGGLLAFHDYRTYEGNIDPDVAQAVNELIEMGGELLSRHDSLAVVRPPVLAKVGV
jgi:SAM-dependent methyltransferase